MEWFIAALGVLVVLLVLFDAFEFIILPRRVSPRVRLARIFLRSLARLFIGTARRIHKRSRRESFLTLFGPLALVLLFALWALSLVLGFAFLEWAFGSHYDGSGMPNFLTDLYTSGTAFFTLGFADITPRATPERVLSVGKAALGLGFLGLVVSYLPVFYQSFAQREVQISMLDEWAGSPPSAGELLRRLGEDASLAALERFLQEWEVWAAELLETHLSYPILATFRSQHDNQSWVAGLTMILDLCALVSVGIEGAPRRAGRLTYAMARHAVGDLCQVLSVAPLAPPRDRLPPDDLAKLRGTLVGAGISLRTGQEADERLAELRAEYEPYVNALSDYLLMELPPWMAAPSAIDNWQTTAWGRAKRPHLTF